MKKTLKRQKKATELLLPYSLTMNDIFVCVTVQYNYKIMQIQAVIVALSGYTSFRLRRLF